MREIQWAQVTVSKQYRKHAFRKPPSTTMDGGFFGLTNLDLTSQVVQEHVPQQLQNGAGRKRQAQVALTGLTVL